MSTWTTRSDNATAHPTPRLLHVAEPDLLLLLVRSCLRTCQMRAEKRALGGTGWVAAVTFAVCMTLGLTLLPFPVGVQAGWQAQPSIPLNTHILLRSATDAGTYVRHASFYIYATPQSGDDSIFKVVDAPASVAGIGIVGIVSFQSVNYVYLYVPTLSASSSALLPPSASDTLLRLLLTPPPQVEVVLWADHISRLEPAIEFVLVMLAGTLGSALEAQLAACVRWIRIRSAHPTSPSEQFLA
jgi:hypothetical protein